MKEYYVPFEAVTEIQEDAVFLDVSKDRIDDVGWDRRPEDQLGAATRTWPRFGAETRRRKGGPSTAMSA